MTPANLDILSRLAALVPAVRDGLPLAIGCGPDLRALAPAVGASKTALRRAVESYVGSTRYLLALARDGSMRHAPDGTPVAPVSPEHRARAKTELTQRTAMRNRAKAKPATPAPANPAHVQHSAPPVLVLPPRPILRLKPRPAP